VARDVLNTHELTGAYRIDASGIPIEEITGEPWAGDDHDAAVHDWGAMGLPDGPRTAVVPVVEHSEADDAAVAAGSAGFQELMFTRDLSLAPGDSVTVGGRSGTLVAIDRRTRIVQVVFQDGDMQSTSMEDIGGHT
jgi:hypothetical protein